MACICVFDMVVAVGYLTNQPYYVLSVIPIIGKKAVGTSIIRNNQSRQLNSRETTATDNDFSSLSKKHPTYHQTSNQGFKTSKLVKYSGHKSILYTLYFIFEV